MKKAEGRMKKSQALQSGRSLFLPSHDIAMSFAF